MIKVMCINNTRYYGEEDKITYDQVKVGKVYYMKYIRIDDFGGQSWDLQDCHIYINKYIDAPVRRVLRLPIDFFVPIEEYRESKLKQLGL
jgi:hypothetical protein